MLPAIRLSDSDRTCCARRVTFPFPKDHAAVVAQASCPVFQTPQAMPFAEDSAGETPLSLQTRCRGYHYNCERKG